jgi:pantetheine-phosphate adenylyltransferase
MKKAIYPGSFDPITNGHVDIIKRALLVFDHLVIAISHNREKSPTFTIDERKSLIKKCFNDDPRIEITSFGGLLVDFAASQNTPFVVRGLRAASDFEYEFQLSAMNRHMNPAIDTVFFMTGSETYFLSSRLVKEVAMLGGDVSKMVPLSVALALKDKRAVDQIL